MSSSGRGWNNVSIADLVANVPNALVIGPFGSDLKVSDYTETGTPVVFVRNVKSGRFESARVRFISERKAKQLKAHTVRPGDLLATKMGDPPCIAAIYPADEPEAVVTADLIKMTVNNSAADERFLMHFLNSDGARSQVAKFTFGVTRPKVTLKDFKSIQVPLPPLPVQKRIAAILDAAERLRGKREHAFGLISQLHRAQFLSLFGDPATNAKRWPMAKLGDLSARFSDGPFGSNLKSEHYVHSGVRVVRLQNIGVGEFLDDDKAFIAERHFAALSKHECLPGDVLIGTLGDPNLRACIQPEWLRRALNKADCVQMRVDRSQVTPEYICALLNAPSLEKKAQDKIQGQTRLRISMGRLRELCVPVPPLAVQQQFSRFVSKLNTAKTALELLAACQDTLSAALQQRAFRGESLT